MTFLGHLVLGGAVVTALAHNIHFESSDPIPFLFGYGIGLLLPDIDEPGSYLGKRFAFVSRMLREIGIEHRTVTHNFFLAFGIAALGFILGSYGQFLVGIGVGALVHDAGDMLTKGGIRGFFSPVYGGTIRLLPKKMCFYTGSAMEYMFIVTLIAAIAWGIHNG